MLNSLCLCSINGKQSLDDSTSVHNTISKYFEYTVKTYSSEKKKNPFKISPFIYNACVTHEL